MFLSGFLLAAAGVATTIGIECASFENHGGWTVETRYPEKGRTYLMAHGSGVPVADAWTDFTVPSGGVYHVWVETRNWTGPFRPKLDGAGRFYLIVNGRTLPQELGGGGDGWWGQPALDDVVLKTGVNRVALHDVSGFGARVASITFSTESRNPGGPKPVIAAEKKVDLVVCGGTVAGLAAAISAARSGLSVALVNDRTVWGGDNSSEGREPLRGCANLGTYPRLGDVLSEFATSMPGKVDEPFSFGDDLKAAAVRREKNVTPYLGAVLESAELDKSCGTVRIASVVIRDLRSGRHTRLVAPLFADCTDSGILGIRAQAETPRDVGGAPRIPEIGFATQPSRRGCSYRTEPWMLDVDASLRQYALQGVWKAPGFAGVKLNDAEEARDYALLTFYSNWASVRNHKKEGVRFDCARHQLAWVSPFGVRETRRFSGDFLLTDRHLREQKGEMDGTCWTTGELADGPIRPFAIPYRCLYSRNVANLFLAGRTISVTREAAVSTDLLRTCGLTGEVVGLAAGVCKRKSCSPRDVGKSRFDDLKAAMIKGAGSGEPFALQDYNLPKSLEADLKGKCREAVWGHLRGPLPASLYIDHMNFVRKNAEAAGVPASRAGRTGCEYLEGLIADAEKLGLTANDLVALHTMCLKLAHNLYLDDRLPSHYEAALKLNPDILKDITFHARYRVHYNALQDKKRFPLSEKEIGFGKTLADFGVTEKKTVHLKDYWNPTNVAPALQRLIDDPEVTTIVLDKMPMPWYLSSVTFGREVTGKRLLLKSGCKVLRDRSLLPPRVQDPGCAMFVVSSAQGVIIESDAERPEDVYIGDYADEEEKRRLCKKEGSSCIDLAHEMYRRTTRNVVIRNLRIANTGQDALHIATNWDPVENVYVEHCVFDGNLRQGCSPCGYYSLFFKDVKFVNTGGTPPGAGVDIEPCSDYLATVNLYFFDCTFGNNAGGGLLIPAVTHEPMLLLAKRCTFQRTPGAQVIATAMPSTYISSEGRPYTDLRFEDCTFESSGRTLNILPYPIYDMTFRNCVIRDVRLPSQKARGGRVPSPIGIELTRSFGKNPDIPDAIRPKITFEDVKVEGFEGAPAIDVSDEIGRMNVKGVFAGALDWNGKKVDLSAFAYEGPDLQEPPTAFVSSSKLKKPSATVAAGTKMPRSNMKLSFSGPWWMKQPAHSAYFWAERGRTVTFDLHVWIPDWMGARTNAVYATCASGSDVKLADVSRGVHHLTYVAPDTGWHRITPGLWLDGPGDMNNGIEHRVDNVQGAVFVWQADTRSECYAKFNRIENDKPYVGYFEVPAGGKPCRIRLNFGGLVIRDPAGNVVESVKDGTYGRRHVFTLCPSTKKAEIWSFEQPAGRAGGNLVGLRFYAPLNGIWADSPEALPCEYAEHFVPEKRMTDETKAADVRLDVKRLPAEVVRALPAAKAARQAFASKREAGARARELAASIEKMKAKGMTDDLQREINDIERGRSLYVRAAAMEEKAARETPEVFETAAFCQAFAPVLALDAARVKDFVAWKISGKALDAFPDLLRALNAPTVEGRITEELQALGLGWPRSVLEYDDPAQLVGLMAKILSALGAKKTYDLVVYGSSPAALTAAIQAKRLGARVVIVSPERRIGGLTTGGLGQTDIGNKNAFGGLALQFYRDVASHYRDDRNWKWQKRSDYLPDGQCEGTKGSDSMWTFEPSAALAVLENWEKREGLEIHRGQRLDRSVGKVKVQGQGQERKIVSFFTEDGTEFCGKMFVDATYEGDLMAAAGVSYFVGRESNAVYGETISGNMPTAAGHNFNLGVDPYVTEGDPKSGLLPNVEPYDPNAKPGDGDRRVQAYCFRMCLTDVPENRIPFAKPAGYRERDYELLFRNLAKNDPKIYEGPGWKSWTYVPWINSKMPNRKTDTNNCRGFSTDFIGRNWAWPEASYAERAKILKEHLDYQQGLMWTLANHPRVPEAIRREVSRWGTCKDEFKDGLGDGWQSQLYIREARRLVGDYVMTEHNCRGKTKAPRPVALGAYTMDSHHVRRVVTKDGFVRNEGNVEDHDFPGPYGIDYGAIIPKRGECANLFVPVCLSASHMAFGSIRMEPVFFALGQVSGTAAVQAIGAKVPVQDLPYEPLRKRLEADGQVLAWK